MSDYKFIVNEKYWDTCYERIENNTQLKYAVGLIISFLEQKVQYYGDRGSLDPEQPNYPRSADTKTFAEIYSNDVKKTQILINSLLEQVNSLLEQVNSLIEQVKSNNERVHQNNGRLLEIEQRNLERNERERNERITAAEKDRDERIAAAEKDRDERIAAAEKDRDERIAAVEKDRDERIAAVEKDRDQKVNATQWRIRELEAQLSARIKENAALERERNEQIAALKNECEQKIDAAQQQRRAFEAQLTNQIKAVEKDRNERVAAAEKDRDERIAAAEKDRDERISAVEKDRDDRISAVEKDRDDRIAAAERERDQKAAELKQKTKELEQKTKELNQISESNEEWLKLSKIYHPVLKSLQKCSTFKSMLDDNHISTDPTAPGNLFTIATLIGNNIDFAKDVHNCALKVKQTNNETITSDEIEVYKALNACYRELWSIDFDLFVMPGGTSVDEPFNKIPFNKNEVVYMKNPRDKTSRYTQAVFVPILKAQTGNLHTPAYVQAGNM